MKSTKFYDKHGRQIHEFDVIKVDHFIGAQNKKHYMYKWVRVRNGELYALHLTNDSLDGYYLKATSEDLGRISSVEVVQSYHDEEVNE
jgi:hypothetical protein